MLDLRNKKVTVVGLGESGLGSALLLDYVGAIVSVTDKNKTKQVIENSKILEKRYIDLEIGEHTEAFLKETELLVVSPGVGKDALPIRYAQDNFIPIISELELGYNFCNRKIIAVTGTNGKSTVVSLIGRVFHSAERPVIICGNIGDSFTGKIFENMGKDLYKNAVVILEVSSFQLEWIDNFRPDVAVILNITPDHLDRYNDFEEYFNTKLKIFKNQNKGDILIINSENEFLISRIPKKNPFRVFCFSNSRKVEGIYKEGDIIRVNIDDESRNLFELKEVPLRGEHNLENILVTALICHLSDIDNDIIQKAVSEFTPLSHRFESIGEIGGVEFIDDSKATNTDSTKKAIESMRKKCILIAGGKDKGLPYQELRPVLKEKVKTIVLIGEAKNNIRKALEGVVPIVEKETMENAVTEAYKISSPGEAVLLSPMCSSFDMFADYKHRGKEFRNAVAKIKKALDK